MTWSPVEPRIAHIAGVLRSLIPNADQLMQALPSVLRTLELRAVLIVEEPHVGNSHISG